MALMGVSSKGYRHSSCSGNRRRAFGMLFLLAFGAAVIGVTLLHRFKERRVIDLLLKDKDRHILSLQFLIQREKAITKEVKRKNEEMKAKIYSLKTQKTELHNKITEMQSMTASLKQEHRALEAALESKLNENKILREKEISATQENPEIISLRELLKQKEAEIEEMKHHHEKPVNIWSVSADDPSNPPVNLTSTVTMVGEDKSEVGKTAEESVTVEDQQLQETTTVKDDQNSTSTHEDGGGSGGAGTNQTVIPGEEQLKMLDNNQVGENSTDKGVSMQDSTQRNADEHQGEGQIEGDGELEKPEVSQEDSDLTERNQNSSNQVKVGESSNDASGNQVNIDESSNDASSNQVKVDESSNDASSNQVKVNESSNDASNNQVKVDESSNDASSNQVKVDESSNDASSNQVKVDESSNDASSNQVKVDESSNDASSNQVKVDESSNDASSNQVKVDESSNDGELMNTGDAEIIDGKDHGAIGDGDSGKLMNPPQDNNSQPQSVIANAEMKLEVQPNVSQIGVASRARGSFRSKMKRRRRRIRSRERELKKSGNSEKVLRDAELEKVASQGTHRTRFSMTDEHDQEIAVERDGQIDGHSEVHDKSENEGLDMKTDTDNQVALEGREGAVSNTGRVGIPLNSGAEGLMVSKKRGEDEAVDNQGIGGKQGLEVSSDSELLKPQNPPHAEDLGSADTDNQVGKEQETPQDEKLGNLRDSEDGDVLNRLADDAIKQNRDVGQRPEDQEAMGVKKLVDGDATDNIINREQEKAENGNEEAENLEVHHVGKQTRETTESEDDVHRILDPELKKDVKENGQEDDTGVEFDREKEKAANGNKEAENLEVHHVGEQTRETTGSEDDVHGILDPELKKDVKEKWNEDDTGVEF